MVLASAARFEAVAAGSRQGMEAELALAIDPLVPTAPLIDSLRALHETHPQLQISFSTEGLGGALRRLRAGDVSLALCLLLPDVPEDVVAAPLIRINLLPVAAADHPLATLGRPASRVDLEAHIQLVLSDPANRDGPNYGLTGSAPWRFVDLGRRMDFLLAGFGWCRMPEHLVKEHLDTGRLSHAPPHQPRRQFSRAGRRRNRPPRRSAFKPLSICSRSAPLNRFQFRS
ncbi:substrate-binding domain-containing protein [Martelella mediterranea]|uniref:DNA-binding transcriptional LysR family regulator n=1 Tax=Martelella mediterranea TaxID=293089 RepID=A0A4R3NG88_9HYPH|nr:substrate-binding domain-containing protein [Martelella mediterranea]TCT32682.1 DNA-binding transcriptional LysR family regulator [Martelella mediterranea]